MMSILESYVEEVMAVESKFRDIFGVEDTEDRNAPKVVSPTR